VEAHSGICHVHCSGENPFRPLSIWPPEKTSSVINRAHGDWKAALTALLIIWTFAAFGEELSYRGYLLNRGAEVGNRSILAYWISVLAVAVLFGYGHWYKGPAAILDSGTAGLVLDGAYLLSRRNLWVPVAGPWID